MASSVASAIETEGGKKTLEEVTLGILDELGAAVRPARYVANEEALQWAIAKMESEKPSELDMEWYSVGDAEATKLAEALKDNTSLKTLKLRYNEIRDQGAIALAKALEKHPNLESLTLGNNIIGSEGAGELARAAASGGRLKNLDLRYNSVGPELPQSFVNLTCLTRLDVSANHLESLPKALGTLTGLESLAVERNHKLAPKNLGEIQTLGDLLAAIRNQSAAAGGDSAMRDA